MIIIKCNRQVYSTHEVTESKCSNIINVTIRYVLPTRLQRESAMIIIYVTFRYVLPTRLQRANAVIIIKCNRQVYSTHEVTKRKCKDYYYRNLQVCSTHEVTESKCSDYYINVTFRYVLPTRLQRACKCSDNYQILVQLSG